MFHLIEGMSIFINDRNVFIIFLFIYSHLGGEGSYSSEWKATWIYERITANIDIRCRIYKIQARSNVRMGDVKCLS